LIFAYKIKYVETTISRKKTFRNLFKKMFELVTLSLSYRVTLRERYEWGNLTLNKNSTLNAKKTGTFKELQSKAYSQYSQVIRRGRELQKREKNI